MRRHRHDFRTKYVNMWGHPTGQECECGLTREFQYIPELRDAALMPYDKGQWVWSNGETSKYSVLDGVYKSPDHRFWFTYGIWIFLFMLFVGIPMTIIYITR